MNSVWNALAVDGVIFHLDSEFVLFEFQFNGEESIGIVPTSKIILSNDEKIPRGSLNINSLGQYLEIGDEIECKVVRNTDADKYVYVEEDQEKVRLRPEWIADQAFILSESRLRQSIQRPSRFAPDVCKKDQSDDQEDLRALLQCRKIEKNKSSQVAREELLVNDSVPRSFKDSPPRKKSSKMDERDRNFSRSNKTERTRKSESHDENTKRCSTKELKAKELTSRIKRTSKASSSNKEPLDQFYKAKLVGIKKPNRSRAFVTTVSMEIINESKFLGEKVVVNRNCLYIYGHPLVKADLSYHLRSGDEFNVEINDVNGSQSIKRAWYNAEKSCSFKEEMSIQARLPNKCFSFKNWLQARHISFDEFNKWILGETPAKTYFPFQSLNFTGVLESIVKENSPFGDGGVIRIMSEGKYKGQLAVFEKSDFYIEGVSVGCSDLRILLRPGNVLNTQILEMTSADKRRYKYMTKNNDISLYGQLCFIGDTAPPNPFVNPHESEGLHSYLSAIGLSVSEFTNMRDVSHNANTNETLPNIQPVPLNGPLTFIKTLLDNLPAQDHSKIMFALSLTVRALGLSTTKDLKTNEDLLQTQEDISNAVWLSKIFTQALIKKLQSKMKGEILDKFGPIIESTLQNQEKQLATYDLIQSQIEAAKNLADTNQSGPSLHDVRNKSNNIKEMMKKVEQQIESKKASLTSASSTSGKGPKRDMKKILESYASSSTSSRRNSKDICHLNPLELLFQFINRNKTIALRNGILYFGIIGYSLCTKTNFIMGEHLHSNAPKQYYTIYDLYFFWKNRKIEHSMYKRMAGKEKVNCVSQMDRQVIIDYLLGKNSSPLNIDNKTFQELNPSPSSLPPEIDSMESSAKKRKLTSFHSSVNTEKSAVLGNIAGSPENKAVPPKNTARELDSQPDPLQSKSAGGSHSSNSPSSSITNSSWRVPKWKSSFSFTSDQKDDNRSMCQPSKSSQSPALNSSGSSKPKVVGFTSLFSVSSKKHSGTGFSSAFSPNQLTCLRK